jgi:NitT/TauT family transport system substrate-binding protein
LNLIPPTLTRWQLFSTLCRLLLFTLALIFASCHKSPTPSGLTKITLQTDWYPQPEHGGFYTALAKGYYKDEGLDVDIQPGSPFVSPYQQVAVGAAQFGMGSSDRILESIGNGQPLVAFAATMQHDPQGIMVRASSPIRSFVDLNRHTVAVQPGSTWFAYIVKRYQLNDIHEIPATFSVANFIADPNYIQQAFATSEPFFASNAGVQTRVLLVSDSGFSPYRVMFTRGDYLHDHAEIVEKFCRASLKGWHEYLVDPKLAHATIAKLNPALNAEWMEFTWRALRDGHFIAGEDPGGAQLGRMDPARWDTLYKQLADLKVTKAGLDPTTAYTTRFLQ